MLLKEGDFLTLETGEYSDFTYVGPFLILKDFDTVEVSKEYGEKDPRIETVKEHKYADGVTRSYIDREGYTPERFIAFLSKEGYVKGVENVTNWHVGSYGRFEPDTK